MKTLALALLFVLSLCSAGLAVRAEAHAWPQPAGGSSGGLAAPVALRPDGDDKDDEEDDDEEDEEELRVTGLGALEQVDPGVADDLLRLRLAAAGR